MITSSVEINIFKYTSYQKYLNDLFHPTGENRGMQTKLAKHLNCQSSYINQVVREKLNLSLEQSMIVAEYLKFTPDETHYFILLVQKSRSGSKELEKYFLNQIKKIQDQQNLIVTNIKIEKESLTLEQKSKYYSSWIYSAIHILTSIPEYQTESQISKKLGLPLKLTIETLEFLKSIQLVVHTNKRWIISNKRIHVNSESPLILQHHFNWREYALHQLGIKNNEGLHYSLVFTLSKVDYQKIQERFLEFIKEIESIYRPSKEEEICSLCLDLGMVGVQE